LHFLAVLFALSAEARLATNALLAAPKKQEQKSQTINLITTEH